MYRGLGLREGYSIVVSIIFFIIIILLSSSSLLLHYYCFMIIEIIFIATPILSLISLPLCRTPPVPTVSPEGVASQLARRPGSAPPAWRRRQLGFLMPVEVTLTLQGQSEMQRLCKILAELDEQTAQDT